MVTLLTLVSAAGSLTNGEWGKTEVPPAVLWGFAISFAAVFLAVVIPYFATRRRYLQNENKRFADVMKHQKEYEKEAIEKLKKSTELATLMELNQGQIKDYHTIVTNQADKSFRSSQTAMGIGITMLVGCLIGGFYVDAAQLRWFLAAVAAISSTMTAFLNRTYLSMYRDSIAQLNRYFDQPVLNSYYLTAERLSEGLGPEAQHEVRRHIIVEVLKTSASMSDKRRDPEESAPEEPKIPKQKKRKQKNPA
ncbi:hypothetical protein [Streptomyces anulatus]|uniref:hypothetical protein n=1 Tax=Streptomyces anulatus TaxID=1892 RepID=UPI0022502D7A|nr:hypothetical protein [Streptomyces anulatus]MCX4504551.1 hypothetical protein [Streptomyces anulatus]